MNLRKLLRIGIIAGWICYGFALEGCAKDKPSLLIGEDVIPTTPKQTITTPDRTGAWFSDRYISDRFGTCVDS